MNVLIVDDQPTNQKVLNAILEAEGHTVAQAADGLEALQLLESHGADVVISDILMPRMDGFRLCSEVRKRETFKHLPFIHYTATYTSISDEKLSSDLGADVFLRKPAPAAEIVATLNRLTRAEHIVRPTSVMPEPDVIKEYSARLVAKLEHRNLELDRVLQQLESERSRLRHLLEHSPVVIYELKIDGAKVTPLIVSDNIERLLGVSVAESTRYEWWLDSLHPEDRERVLDVLAQSLTGDGYSIEYRIRHKDGSYHWVEDNTRMIRDATGQATAAVGVWTDITERKRAEKILLEVTSQESSRRKRTTRRDLWTVGGLTTLVFLVSYHFNLFAEALRALSDEKRYPLVNETFAAGIFLTIGLMVFSYRRWKESTGEVVSQKHVSKALRILHDELDKQVRQRTAELGRANDALRTNIAERERASVRLREQARLLDLAQDAIIVRDMQDRVEFWNHGAEKLYGWTAEEVQGRKASDFLYKDDPATTAAARETVLEHGKWSGECKHRCKDGGTVVVRGRWTLVQDELGAPSSILIINTDVTEQKKLETHLLRAQRLESLGTLAGGVAHDLNNILTPILMCAEMLQDAPRPEDIPALVSLIEESAVRGTNVVKQVLTFARGIEGERVVIKPSHLVQEMVDIAQKTFPKAIQIVGRYADDLWSIKCDPSQLHQVLLNLSVNARDAIPNGGSIIISAENSQVDEHYASVTAGAKPGPHLMFSVSDTGAGMSRATIDKMFDPFFTTKEIGKGTGLGLSTVLGIVKGHGGFISVQSEIGTGTTFKIFLPAKVGEESVQQLQRPLQRLDGNGEHVLVVDDEASIVRMTKIILEKHNYHVLTAESGPDALALTAQQIEPIKIVLTDLSMPLMDGVVLVGKIKEMKPATLFIVSTGRTEEPRTRELESLGVTSLLTKPYDTQTLLTTVRETLSNAPDRERTAIHARAGLSHALVGS